MVRIGRPFALVPWLIVAGILMSGMASAGFEVHEIEGPTAPIPPGGSASVSVDLDIDCSSAWLHDPYVIDVAIDSAAQLQGPTSLEVPASACDGPSGITEHILEYNTTLPADTPAYQDVPIVFAFTSSSHPLDASESHNGSIAVQADGAPAIEATPATANVTMQEQGNVTLLVRNIGNVDVEVSFSGTDVQRLDVPSGQRIEQGGQTEVTIGFEPDEDWQSLVTVINITGTDEQGKVSDPATVRIAWQREEVAKDNESPAPLLLLPLLFALWRRRH